MDYLSILENKIIPIEVKSGKGTALKSLHSFLSSHSKSIYGIKVSISARDENKILSIPLYGLFEVVEGGVEKVRSLLK